MSMKLYLCMEIFLSSRFMSIILWPRKTHLVPRLSQNASCGWGTCCHPLSFETFPFFNSQTASRYITSNLRVAGGTRSDPFWCLCQKLSLSLLYFNKTSLHKSLEWSSLGSGPGLWFFSSGGQESWRLLWFSNSLSLSSWWFPLPLAVYLPLVFFFFFF